MPVAAPALAEGTAGVELAGRVEKVTVAKLEALGPKELVYGDAGHKHEMPYLKARLGI